MSRIYKYDLYLFCIYFCTILIIIPVIIMMIVICSILKIISSKFVSFKKKMTGNEKSAYHSERYLFQSLQHQKVLMRFKVRKGTN